MATWFSRHNIALFFSVMIMVSLLFSKFMITIGMIGLLALSLFDKNISRTFQQYVHAPAFLAITGVFFIYLVSGLYSDDLGYFGDRMRIKLPFIILPFAFVGFPKLSERTYYSLLLFFFYFILRFFYGEIKRCL